MTRYKTDGSVKVKWPQSSPLLRSLCAHVPGTTKSRRKAKRDQTKRRKFIFVTLPVQSPGRWNSSGQTLSRFVDLHANMLFQSRWALCVLWVHTKYKHETVSLLVLTVLFGQVVEIKLQFEIYEKRLKALSLQKASAKGTFAFQNK